MVSDFIDSKLGKFIFKNNWHIGFCSEYLLKIEYYFTFQDFCCCYFKFFSWNDCTQLLFGQNWHLAVNLSKQLLQNEIFYYIFTTQ